MNLKKLMKVKDNLNWIDNIVNRIKAYYGVGRRIKEEQYEELINAMTQNEALSKKIMQAAFPANIYDKKQININNINLDFCIRKKTSAYGRITTSKRKYANVRYDIINADTNQIIGSSEFSPMGHYDAKVCQDACKAQALFNVLGIKI